jgi:RHS repeat-associated protein
MRAKLFGFILCILFSSFLFGQTATNTTSSAEKFNRRGYLKNDAITKNDHEVISDYDGNLMLHYSTSVELPYDLGSDFTITYNPNVEHRVFYPLINYTGTGGNVYFYNMGIPINSPEWILGYKGFALQTLNLENFQYVDQTVTKPEYIKKETPMMIPGYHYGNFYGTFGIDATGAAYGSVIRDYITILRADGSKMVLRNAEYDVNNANQQLSGATQYTGLYVEEGNETKGFAKVTYNAYDNNSNLTKRRRVIEYRSGDGLVYTFDELLAHIEDDTLTSKKVIMLSKVSNPAYTDNYSVTPRVNFTYSTSLSIVGGTLAIHGRPLLTSISYYSGITTSVDKVTLDWNYYTLYNTFIGLKIYNLTNNQTMNLNTYEMPFRNAASNLRIAVKGKRLFPTKIQFYEGTGTTALREDAIAYYVSNSIPTTFRNYSYNGTTFCYKDSTYLPASITYYNNQKTEFEFHPSTFGNTYPNFFVDLATSEHLSSYNMGIAQRDCYTNYMLKKRTIYTYLNSAFTAAKQEDYDYSTVTALVYNLPDGSTYSNSLTGTLKTTITVTDRISNTVAKTIEKYFDSFPTSFKNLSANYDSYKTSKLVKEIVKKTSSSDQLKKEYAYDLGYYQNQMPSMPNWPYFDGSFALKSVKETETIGSNSTANLKSTNFTFKTINYGTTWFSKKIIATETSKDTSTQYSYKAYNNIINDGGSSSVTYTTASSNYPDYFKLGLPLTEKSYGKSTPSSSELVLDHTTYTYSTATSTAGDDIEVKNLVHTISKNNQASTRLATTTLWYATLAGTSSYGSSTLSLSSSAEAMSIISPMSAEGETNTHYPGYIRTTQFPKGATQRFYYPSGSTYSVGSIVATQSGDTYTYSTAPAVRYFKPWKAIIGFDNIRLNTYTKYNNYGLLEYEFDVNGYYSAYTYDSFGRLTNAYFPGCFGGTSSSTTDPMAQEATMPSVAYTYYDTQRKITGTSYMNFTSSKTFEFEDYYDPLANFLYKKEKNDSGTLEQLNSKVYNGLDLVTTENTYAVGTTSKVTKNYTYDYLGRLLTTTIGDVTIQSNTYAVESGSFTRSSYTVNYVRKTTVTDGESKSVTTYFDLTGKKVAEKIGTNDATLFVYNEAYQLTAVVTPEGKVTTYTYDSLGFLASKTTPDEGTYNYKYSKYGELRYQFHTTQTPLTLLYHNYDKLGRLEVTGTRSITASAFNSLTPDANSTADNTYTNMTLVNVYDDISGIGSAYYATVFSGFSLPSGVTLANIKGKLALTAYRDNTSGTWSYKAYSYDYAGRVASVYVKDAVLSTPVWKTITNSYDHMENLTQQVADGFRYRYEYDNRARLKKVYTKAASETAEKNDAEYVYNIASQITQQKLPAALNTNDAINYTYDYSTATDPKGWLTTINNTNPSTSTVRFNEGLTYFTNGNVNTQAITNHGNGSWAGFTYTYGYDAMNRISSAANTTAAYGETYTYNQDGGIATKVRNGSTTSYAYVTGTHKLATAGSGSFTYDAKGNVTADGSSSVTLTSYDFRNLPLAITASGTNYTYKYNDGGNRIYKEGSTTKDYYLYDHTGRALLIYDMNTSNLKTANIYGSGLIGRVDLSGGATGGYYERMYYIKDHLGSIRVGISSVTTTNNNITYACDYYPFGETQREYTSGSNKYKFTEKERDAESSYDYFGARYYNNKLGVWLSADPLADKYPGFSPFNYCVNNPLRLVDPTGMSFEDGFTTVYKASTDDDPDGKKKIGVDPGHGDHNNRNSKVDPGAVNGSDYEKDIALEISVSVKNTLLDAGFDVVQTREGDVEDAGAKLAWRLKKIEGAEMLVSIHINANKDLSANGFSVLYSNKNVESKKLAESIANSNLLLRNKGCQETSSLYVLNKFKAGPAVLVEAGFISNKGDLGILKGKAGEIGQAIGKGIINYLGEQK